MKLSLYLLITISFLILYRVCVRACVRWSEREKRKRETSVFSSIPVLFLRYFPSPRFSSSQFCSFPSVKHASASLHVGAVIIRRNSISSHSICQVAKYTARPSPSSCGTLQEDISRTDFNEKFIRPLMVYNFQG